MSGGPTRSTQEAIVRALTQALEQELGPEQADRTAPHARDVAQVLALDGLDRALSIVVGKDPRVEPLRLRILALAAECAAEGRLDVFTRADAELDRLAAEYGAPSNAPVAPSEETGEGLLKLSDALEDLPITGEGATEIAHSVRLTPPVAAALRAALDWLCQPGGTRPLRLKSEDALLEIRCEAVAGPGISLAAAVLATAGGNLGPTPGGAGSGSWTLRVPTESGRASFLMVMQGDLPLALPWHSVLRMSMASAGAVDSSIRSLGLPVLKPLSPLSTSAHEYPIVLVGHGLKRAYLVADQLVWRLPANPVEPVGGSGLREAVAEIETDDGDRYHLLDPARLLEEVQDLPVPMPVRKEVRTPEPPVAPPSPPPPVPFVPRPPVAGPPPAPLEPPAPPIPVPPVPSSPPVTREAPEAPRRPRAVVADDSVASRISLSRLLEVRGFDVTPIGTARELLEVLSAGEWSVVFVDVDLPDARGRGLLDAVMRRAAAAAPESPLVALVRDDAERAIADQAGLAAMMKPFRISELDELIRGLGPRRHDAP